MSVRRGNRGGAVVHAPAKASAVQLGLLLQSDTVPLADLGTALQELEPTCAALAARRTHRGNTLIPKLKRSTGRWPSTSGRRQVHQIGGQFHDEVVRGCGNDTMIAVVGSLEKLWTGHLNWWAKETAARGEYPSMAKRRIALTVHTKLTDAIEAGDGERARKLAARHIADTRHTSARAIPSSGSSHCRRRHWPDASAERCCVRTALITGGSGGIGRNAAAGSLSSATARSSQRGVRPSRHGGGNRRSLCRRRRTHPERFAPAVEAAGEIDLLVHASGILGGTYARKQTFEQWKATISANLDSCFVVTSAALPQMKAGSRFVFISSSAAHEPMMARTAYSASKAGMNAFAGALAQEVDRDGINVHIVTPGPVETDMLQDVPFEMYAIRAADVADAVAWLDTLDPSIDLPEIRLQAVTRGPSARPPVVPLEVERRVTRTK